MNRVICVCVLLLCGRVQAQVLPIPAGELRPYAELEELLLGERLKEIEALRSELTQLEQAMTHEKRRLSPAEKRELTKSKARIKAIDADIEKLKRAKLSAIPKMTLEQAMKQKPKSVVAYIVEDGKPAVMTIANSRNGLACQITIGGKQGELFGGADDGRFGDDVSGFKYDQRYSLDKPCEIISRNDGCFAIGYFFDDSPLLEAKKAKDVR